MKLTILIIIFSLSILIVTGYYNVLFLWSDMSYYDINFYGRIVDSEKNYHPELSRNDRIYLKYIETDPARHSRHITKADSAVRLNYHLN